MCERSQQLQLLKNRSMYTSRMAVWRWQWLYGLWRWTKLLYICTFLNIVFSSFLCRILISAGKSCPLGQFMCKSTKKCIIFEWFCDQEADCEDFSDELHPNCTELRSKGNHFKSTIESFLYKEIDKFQFHPSHVDQINSSAQKLTCVYQGSKCATKSTIVHMAKMSFVTRAAV